MGKIRIVKKDAEDYTFTGDGLDLTKLTGKQDASGSKDSAAKDKEEREYRLRAGDVKPDKLRHKSKLTGGHNKQGHSPVYE